MIMITIKKVELFLERKGIIIFFSILITCCLFANFYAAMKNGHLGPDGSHYASLGKNIIELGKYQSNGSHFPDIIQPPTYPLLISLFYIFIKDAVISGFFVTSLFKCLSVIPLFLIGRKIFNNRLSIIACFFFICYPLVFSNSLDISTESLFCFFFLWAVYLFFRDRNFISSLVTGILIGLAYSIRVEGFLLLISFCVVVFLEAVKNKKFMISCKYIIFCLAGFLLIYVPLTTFVYINSGQVIFCPKIRLIQIHQQIWGIAKYDPAFNSLSEELKYEKSIFKYSQGNQDLLANRILFKEESIQNEKSLKGIPVKTPLSGKIKHALHICIYRSLTYFKNVFLVYKYANYHIFIPPLLILTLFLGFFNDPWSHRGWQINCKLIIIIFISSAFLFSHFDFRFFIPIIALTLLWCAKGALHIIEWAYASLNNVGYNIARQIISIIVIGGIILTMIPSCMVVMESSRENMNSTKNLAYLIRKNLESDATVISRNPQSSFLANRKYEPLPYVDFQGLLEYSKKFTKPVLMFCMEDKEIRPELNNQLDEIIKDYPAENSYEIIVDKNCTFVKLYQ